MYNNAIAYVSKVFLSKGEVNVECDDCNIRIVVDAEGQVHVSVFVRNDEDTGLPRMTKKWLPARESDAVILLRPMEVDDA